jgi:hypothetical protein
MIAIAFMLKDFVRERMLTPSIQLVRLVNDLPQAFIWFIFIAIAFMLAYASMNKWKFSGFKFRKKKQTGGSGHVEKLTRMVKKGEKGGFSRYQLFQYLGYLCVDALAYKEKTTSEGIMKRLGSGSLDAPSDIITCLQLLFPDNRNGYGMSGGRGSWREKRLEHIKLEPLQIVEFLEQQLEVFNGAKDQ